MEIEVIKASKVIKQQTILEEISLKLSGGHIYGIRGRNGAGKTMLLRLLCGLILPTSGVVKIDGEVLGERLSFPDSVGVLLEQPSFIDSYSGLKNLELIAGLKKRISQSDIVAIMEALALAPDKKKFKKYSLGMKQKLGIAAALMESPALILLDEPLNALDEESAPKVLQLLKARRAAGALIVVVSHDREELTLLADEIYELKNGQLFLEEELREK